MHVSSPVERAPRPRPPAGAGSPSVDAALAQQPRRADQRVARERQLDLRGEDPHLAALGVVDEHGLGEAEVARDRLALGLGHLGAVEEHAERVAAAAVAAQNTRTTCRVAAGASSTGISGGSGGGR